MGLGPIEIFILAALVVGGLYWTSRPKKQVVIYEEAISDQVESSNPYAPSHVTMRVAKPVRPGSTTNRQALIWFAILSALTLVLRWITLHIK